MFDIDKDGKYIEKEISMFTEYVNNTMTMNFTDQKSLGPYEGTVKIPRLSKVEAAMYLNNDIKPPPSTSTSNE